MSHRDHVRTLVLLEVRRGAPMVGRIAAFGGVAVAVFALTGHGTGENFFAAALGTSLAFVMVSPLLVVRDKLEGTFEVVRNLPTPTSVIAAAKLVSAALFTAPPAVQISVTTVAIAGVARSELPWLGAAVFVQAWTALTLAAWLLLGVLTRYELERLNALPGLAVALMFAVVGPLLTRWVPDPIASLRWFLAQPWAATAVAAGAILLAAACGLAAFSMVRRGLAEYQPARLRVLHVR